MAGDRKVYNVVGDLLERLSKDTVDKYGYTCVGAVIGATYPMDIRDLRRRLEKTFSWCQLWRAGRQKQKMCSMLSMNMVTEPSSILPEASSAPGRKPEKRERILAKQPGCGNRHAGRFEEVYHGCVTIADLFKTRKRETPPGIPARKQKFGSEVDMPYQQDCSVLSLRALNEKSI